ncbi:hypothetical protein QNH10_09110 [Sporosarcina thermotolerans]|nr:hypothetical protein [Sporosarcina thermotolerans]WHT50009.1 hypothetical protein QNH10_09110 [Sporosarcina thermotolerans]
MHPQVTRNVRYAEKLTTVVTEKINRSAFVGVAKKPFQMEFSN